MAVHIDRINTTVELTAGVAPAPSAAGERSASSGAAPAAAAAELRELVGRMMAEELDSFLRNRGISG